MAQHALGRKDDKRLADAPAIVPAMHLTPQKMEVLRRRAGIHHLHIVFRAELQEALDARAGMFRTLAFVAVRQQQNQSAGLAPFGFGARR